MAAVYPASIKTFVNPTASDPDTNPPHATQHADANDEINATQTTLGANPQGVHGTVKARLEAIEGDVTTAEGDIVELAGDVLALEATANDLATTYAPIDHDHDAEYEPLGAPAQAVQDHENDAEDPHTAAGYVRAKVWNGSAWVVLGGVDIFVQGSGDPDPSSVMTDGDILVDAT